MRLALEEAQMALAAGEIPVGAVVTLGDTVLCQTHNRREELKDPTAHAEILALREAARIVHNWRLEGCTLYVTLEPCPMCAGAIVQSRLQRLVYGAADTLAGCAGSIYRITEDPAFSAYVPAIGGILAEESSALLASFFRKSRAKL